MARQSRREALLKAAAAIVRRDGADALTLDAVAREAGVSKGGLLYHFDSKEALVAAMVAALVEGFDARLSAAEGGAPGAFTRSYLEATAETDDEALALSAGLLAAVAIAPESLAPLRARYRSWGRRLRGDGIDEADAMIVRLAADGLWLADLLGLEPPGRKLRGEVVARLASWTRPARGSR
ncbi:MAG: TetR/AcrR family transcriptional regulator [Polyangiales bacterium]